MIHVTVLEGPTAAGSKIVAAVAENALSAIGSRGIRATMVLSYPSGWSAPPGFPPHTRHREDPARDTVGIEVAAWDCLKMLEERRRIVVRVLPDRKL